MPPSSSPTIIQLLSLSCSAAITPATMPGPISGARGCASCSAASRSLSSGRGFGIGSEMCWMRFASLVRCSPGPTDQTHMLPEVSTDRRSGQGSRNFTADTSSWCPTSDPSCLPNSHPQSCTRPSAPLEAMSCRFQHTAMHVTSLSCPFMSRKCSGSARPFSVSSCTKTLPSQVAESRHLSSSQYASEHTSPLFFSKFLIRPPVL
mmetsp:Transcript_10479/g.23912  ORF Transcript_10479/g.23912 Transcript_10479/m.23912 type:complete len:205 (+) Transcript_10479:253-867(+)